jgi:hypothetical protein
LIAAGRSAGTDTIRQRPFDAALRDAVARLGSILWPP